MRSTCYYYLLMKPQELKRRLEETYTNARIEVIDLTGTEDHWQAVVISAQFAGKSLIQRHRLVNAELAEELKGPIHALTLDVKTPDER